MRKVRLRCLGRTAEDPTRRTEVTNTEYVVITRNKTMAETTEGRTVVKIYCASKLEMPT